MKLFVSKQLSVTWRIGAALIGSAALVAVFLASSHRYDLANHQFDPAVLVVVACAGVAMLGAAIAGKAPI